MQDHWDLGRWGGLPVTMHWTVLLAFPWLFLWMRDLVGAAIGTVAFLLLLAAHEFGHVYAARWRRIPVYGINFSGMHGETSRGHARTVKDDVLVAWAGVGAQVLVLAAAYGLWMLVGRAGSPLLATLASPVFVVWTQWNIFLMIVALLPIGPMDGHAAWKIIPLVRNSFRREPRSEKVVKLSAARRRQLNEDSERKASEIIERMKRKQ